MRSREKRAFGHFETAGGSSGVHVRPRMQGWRVGLPIRNTFLLQSHPTHATQPRPGYGSSHGSLAARGVALPNPVEALGSLVRRPAEGLVATLRDRGPAWLRVAALAVAIVFLATEAVLSWVVWATGPVHGFFFFFVDPATLILRAGLTAGLVVVVVLIRGDWFTTIWRSALALTVALFVLVGQLASTDVQAASMNPSGPYQCFYTNGVGSTGKLSKYDALYFTLGTLTTAGTGNVAPTSQVCRNLVGEQTFIGAVVILLGVGGLLSRVMQRVAPKELRQHQTALALSYIRQGDLARASHRFAGAEQLYRQSFATLGAFAPLNRSPYYRSKLLATFETLALGLDTAESANLRALSPEAHQIRDALAVAPPPSVNRERDAIAGGVAIATLYIVGVTAVLVLLAPAQRPRWTVQSVENPPATPSAFAAVSCSSNGSCMAVGNTLFRALSESSRANIWKLAPQPKSAVPDDLSGVACPSASTCVAVGGSGDSDSRPARDIHPLAARWNGTRWTAEALPLPGDAVLPPGPTAEPYDLFSVSCTSSRACTAGGYYGVRGGSVAALIERWDGSQWKVQRAPHFPSINGGSELRSISCTSSSFCVAVGTYASPVGEVPIALWWNGRAWATRAIPSIPGADMTALQSVSCTSDAACTAVGYYRYFRRSDGFAKALVVRWNGQRWKVTLGLHLPRRAKGSALWGISCTSATTCVAAGSYNCEIFCGPSQPAIGSQPLVERANGSGWSSQQTPSALFGTGGAFASVWCSTSALCVAVGTTRDRSGSDYPLAERYS
jgi:hypothetical protein